MFFEVFLSLCEQKKITPTHASAEIGFSKGSVSYWRKQYHNGIDAKPDMNTAQKIADYFGVTVDYLLERVPTAPQSSVLLKDILAQSARREPPTIVRDNPLAVFRENPVLTDYELLIIAEYRADPKMRDMIDQAIKDKHPEQNDEN